MGKIVEPDVPKGFKRKGAFLVPEGLILPETKDAGEDALRHLKAGIAGISSPRFRRLGEADQSRVINGFLTHPLLPGVAVDSRTLIETARNLEPPVRLDVTKLVLESAAGGKLDTEGEIATIEKSQGRLSSEEVSALLEINRAVDPRHPTMKRLMAAGLELMSDLTPRGLHSLRHLASTSPVTAQERIGALPGESTFGMELELQVLAEGQPNPQSTQRLFSDLQRRFREELPGFRVKWDADNVEVTTPDGGLKNTAEDWKRFATFIGAVQEETRPHDITYGMHLRSGLPHDISEARKAVTYTGKAFEYWFQQLSPTPSLGNVRFPQNALFGDDATEKSGTHLYHNLQGGKPTIAFNGFEMPPLKQPGTFEHLQTLVGFCMHLCHSASARPRDFTVTGGWLPVFEGGDGTTPDQRNHALASALDRIYGGDTTGKQHFLTHLSRREKNKASPSESTDVFRQKVGWKPTQDGTAQPIHAIEAHLRNLKNTRDPEKVVESMLVLSAAATANQQAPEILQELMSVSKDNQDNPHIQEAVAYALAEIGSSRSPAAHDARLLLERL